jgi:hypothetical protein
LSAWAQLAGLKMASQHEKGIRMAKKHPLAKSLEEVIWVDMWLHRMNFLFVFLFLFLFFQFIIHSSHMSDI